jgi:hypothetical protein
MTAPVYRDITDAVVDLVLAARKIELDFCPDHQGWPVPIIRGLEDLRKACEAFKNIQK